MPFSRECSICLVSGVLLVVLAPLLAGIARGDSARQPGPGDSSGRSGRARHGRPFTFYKFRTMRPEVDPFGPSPKSGDDPRLTRLGRFLREYSLDELPQLVNILQGDMSLVGPRPLYVAQMAEWDERQRKRLFVKPGLTGLAQISGPRRADARRETGARCPVRGAGEPRGWTPGFCWSRSFGSSPARESTRRGTREAEWTRGQASSDPSSMAPQGKRPEE